MLRPKKEGTKKATPHE